jgi:uncharacterized protein YjbI with pentapeptide repeats
MGLAAFKRRAEAAKFEGETFEGLDLRSMKAFGSQWKDCVFRDCKFDLSDLRNTRFEGCLFLMCSIRLVNFTTSFFEGTQFDDCDLEQTSFRGSHFTRGGFSNCRMAYGDEMFQDATVKVRLAFERCNLHGSNLDFREVEFDALSFAETNCWGAKVSLGCAVWNAKVDERMQKQFLALVGRVRDNPAVDALAGEQKAIVDRLMRERK